MTTMPLLAPPTSGEAVAEQRYLFVLTPRNRGELLDADALKPLKRRILAQWAAWRRQRPDQWTPELTQAGAMVGQFLEALQAKRDKSAQQLAHVLLHDPHAQRNLECLAALDIFEDKWVAYVQHPTTMPFAHPATLIFAGWHAVQQADRAFQHEAHGHAAKKGLPTHDPEPNPPEAENLQALFAERIQAVLEPLAQALRAAFVAAPPAVEAPPDRQLAWFADDPSASLQET